MVLTIVVDLVAVASDYAEIGLLKRAIWGLTVTEAEALANDQRQAVVGLIQLLVFIFTVTSYLMWIHRAHRNLPSLGARGLRFTPGWAVGWFFVPIMNLFRPYQAVSEIWKASGPALSDGTSWKDIKTPPLIQWWWGFFILANFVSGMAGRMAMSGGDSLGELLIVSWLFLAADGLEIVGALFALLVVKDIDLRQEDKSRALSPFSPPPGIEPRGY